ncbi:MAG: TetR/AcrR family transcriptional regulator, partial [Pygmaiobacter sp.]
MNETRSPKELAILCATLRLLSGGAELHALKMSAIALEAGIGKGTIYEYFPSKEDLFRQALLYCMEQEQREFELRLRQCPDFKSAIYALFTLVKTNCANPMSSFRLMLSGMSPEQRPFIGLCSNEVFRAHMEDSERQLHSLLQRGIDEGMLSPATEPCYRSLALKAAVAAYVLPGFPETPDDALKDIAWSILLKI